MSVHLLTSPLPPSPRSPLWHIYVLTPHCRAYCCQLSPGGGGQQAPLSTHERDAERDSESLQYSVTGKPDRTENAWFSWAFIVFICFALFLHCFALCWTWLIQNACLYTVGARISGFPVMQKQRAPAETPGTMSAHCRMSVHCRFAAYIYII